MTDLETSESLAIAPLSEGEESHASTLGGGAVLNGSANLDEGEPTAAETSDDSAGASRPVRNAGAEMAILPAAEPLPSEVIDPLPAQLSHLSVATLRADLAETQRQVELISDAFAQAVDVISDTLAPSESKLRESVVAAVTQESQSIRQALSQEWSERAEAWSGHVDQRLADQVATLAAAIDARWRELGDRLSEEIRALQPATGTAVERPARDESGEWTLLREGLTSEVNRRIEEGLAQHLGRALDARMTALTTELNAQLRSLAAAPNPGVAAAELDNLQGRFSAGLAELSQQLTQEIRGLAAVPPAPSPTAGDIEDSVLRAVTTQHQHAERAIVALESRLTEQLTLRLTEQHQDVRQWLESRLDDLGSRLQSELTRLTPPPSSENLSAVDVEVVANAVRTIASELTDLRQQVGLLAERPAPAPPAMDMSRLAEPLSAAFEKLDQTVGERMNGLFEAVREELTTMSDARTRAIRRELDRVLYIATGLFGVLSGAFLWLLLRH